MRSSPPMDGGGFQPNFSVTCFMDIININYNYILLRTLIIRIVPQKIM
ncbi:MAG: hypothetical protein O4861_00825 [Trichodesmium sp. St16_bin4-tuft]|nr:hypothetical protein [Trichodesmium sp. St5_bin8]MDE5096958.1 hypothetical protein [Trichodesmium sp. St16_bin4-tuft]MDE5103159.1 hypothetical protein [Trichodesmium sp. St19_bin2]